MAANNVLILGHGTRAFLTVIRSLGRMGHTVHVAMCPPDDLALKSRFVHQRHDIRSDAWLPDMLDLLKKIEFSLVLPCGDESMHPVQTHARALGEFAPVYAYDSQLYDVAFNKFKSTKLAIELGIPVPPQFEIAPDTKVDDILEHVSLPLVLKPPSSIDENDTNVRCEVVRVRTMAEIAARLGEFTRFSGGAVAQENFIGVGVGVELLAKDGEVLVAFQHQRVHEPIEGGGSSYRRSEPLHPELLKAAEDLIRALNYTGVVMVEFKFNHDTGQWIFIEINGRFWGSLPLAVAAGVDFPAYLYRMRMDLPLEYPGAYKVGIHARSLLDDYHWFAKNLRADHNDPTQATVPLGAILGELGNVVRGKERIDTLVLDDLRPAFAEVARLVGRIMVKLGSTLRTTMIPGFVLNRRASRVRNRVQQARNVGFLCYGNICRSPFAAQYAKQQLTGSAAIWSGGFHPRGERPVPELGVVVARKMGVDLSSERSTVVDQQLVDGADVIFVFDEKNMQAMQTTFPGAMQKVFFLSDAIGAREREIEDPYGGAEADFDKAYQTIKASIDGLLSNPA